MNASKPRAAAGDWDFTLELICGRWKIPILVALKGGPKRTLELVRALPGVSKNRLNDNLRQLARAGLVRRRSYAGAVPRVVYEATPLGHSLCPVVEALHDWGRKNRRKIEKSRSSR